MQEVGEYLQNAIKSNKTVPTHKDTFARTAYNRYYYACYLYVRHELHLMNNNWILTGHKNIPLVLKTQVSRELTRMKELAKNTEDRRFYSQISTAITSTAEITKTLSTALSVRYIADYNPEISVEFHGRNEILLESVSLETAKEWLVNITFHMRNILMVWNQRNE